MKISSMKMFILLPVLLIGITEKTAAQSTYPATVGAEYLLYPGEAVLEGQIINSRTGTSPKTFTIRVENVFDGSEQQVLVQTDENGNFRTKIPLPHPQFVYIDNVDYAFLYSGDTLCGRFYAGGNQEFSGNGTSAQVNRKWQELSLRYFGKISSSYEAHKRGEAGIMAYRDTLVRVIDLFAKEIRKGTPPEWGEVSPLTADILKTLVLEEAFRRIIEVEYFVFRENLHEQKERKSDILDEKKFFSFLKKRQALLLDNPLILCSSTQWVLFNRLEFGLYKSILFYANRFSVSCPANTPEELMLYANRFTLPRKYNAQFLRKALAMRKDTLFTGKDYYAAVLKDLHEKYGIGNTFMFQLLLVRSILSNPAEEPELSPDIWAAYIANAIPYVTHPLVCRQLIECYRNYVIRHEGQNVTGTSTPEADSILQRITAPYRGNVLFMDFWGMGCGPCRTGMMAQRKTVEEMKEQPIRFLYLCQDERQDAEQFLHQNNIHGEHIFLTPDEWNYLSAKFSFSSIPFQIIIDRQGNIHPCPVSNPSRELLEKYINQP